VLSVFVFLHSLVARIRFRDDEGQTTAEYALVLLGAATVALVVVTWATRSGKVTALLDGVIDQILSKL
jgi:Flp pilus assembly pilin Flp